MKIDKKIVSLLDNGISSDLLSELNESQINSLYKRLVEIKKENKEAVQKTVTVLNTGDTKDMQYAENCLKNPNSPGCKNIELSEKFESKKQQKYFYSKCGDGKTKEEKKWCKMAKEFSSKTNFKKLPEKKKKETKEEFSMGKDYFNKIASTMASLHGENMKNLRPTPKFSMSENDIEKDIMNILENNLSPKMSKKDFLRVIMESDTEEAPVKPKTPTKPKTPPKPDTPYRPNPSVKPGPKAKRERLPNWLTFDAIGIKFK